MKKLILIRHGKSDWDNAFLSDFERPLSSRGAREAKFVSKILKKLEIKIDLILCSSSNRTRETLEGLWEELDADNEKIIFDKGIYDFHMSDSLDYYIDLIGKIEEDKNNVVIIGHNNFITSLVRYLTGNGELNMETLGVSMIDFQIDKWEKINEKRGNLVFFLSPKYLMD